MKKILIFAAIMLAGGVANAAVRDGNATSRTNTQTRISTTAKSDRGSARQTVLAPATASRASVRATAGRAVSPTTTRAASNTVQSVSSRAATPQATATARQTVSSRPSGVQTSRAAATANTAAASETRTGAEYERCKTAYFTCMDQFCQFKNDDYRRCSCSNRVNELSEIRTVMQQAGNQLTVFTENLDVVGMTAAQATAMRNASEGENALTTDTSASKALLQAIMNSIRGGDTSVGGKYSDLNSINLSFDTTNAFGTLDAGQAVASYNGQNLYSAVYPQCRQAVKADCNDASLQRAITAYLMAIEQDCNTVQTAIEEKQKQIKSAVREGSAMLDLARVENRQKHNSDDITTCLNNVEAAVLSSEVCGPGYRKCLDNGEFIDVSTGAPIAGVVRFYELEELLTFNDGTDIATQKLSKIKNNRTFVQNFEKRVKKFAEPALDKCREQADVVWDEYLDKAMLDIYYAQKAKVSEIKQGCFDFVSTCYMNGDAALTAAMKELIGDSSVVLQPDRVALNGQLCKDYVQSCNNMFDGDIISQYIEKRENTDTLAACRAVAKQCFDKFGGSGYENFYYPYSGLITTEQAANWFSLYELSGDPANPTKKYKSECAKQLSEIPSCSDEKMIEEAFGGFDTITANKGKSSISGTIYYWPSNANTDNTKYIKYGLLNKTKQTITDANGNTAEEYTLADRNLRPTGVATEIYNQIIDILSTQCTNLQGRFVETQFIKEGLYNQNNFCESTFKNSKEYNSTMSGTGNFMQLYGIKQGENMCPRDYGLGVDTQSWGACLCWENGARRSKDGKSPKCTPAIPVKDVKPKDAQCQSGYTVWPYDTQDTAPQTDDWCTQPQNLWSDKNQVCPLGGSVDKNTGFCKSGTTVLDTLPDGL